MNDDEEIFDKVIGQLRLTIGAVLHPLRMYGQDHYVDTAIEELVSLAVQCHQKLSGIEVPYYVNEDKLHW